MFELRNKGLKLQAAGSRGSRRREESLNSQTERHETNERSAGLRPAAAPNEIAASSVSERASQCGAAAAETAALRERLVENRARIPPPYVGGYRVVALCMRL